VDYSHFARYETDLATDEDMARHIEWLYKVHGKRKDRDTGHAINARRLLSEQLQFLDSRDSLGLQLADMLASILRRSLNSRLQKPGWKDFGKLVIHDPKPGWFVQLGQKSMSLLFRRASSMFGSTSITYRSRWSRETKCG
jgi:hypothetical protein